MYVANLGDKMVALRSTYYKSQAIGIVAAGGTRVRTYSSLPHAAM